MRIDFAPMEGITGWPFRAVHARMFPSGLRYYTPFIAANGTFSLKTKEKKEIALENNIGVMLVPQILTNRADAFLWAAGKMAGFGYETVNLNLGCPSPTVVTHGKGAGFLQDPAKLDAFFEEIFEGAVPRISVKTRIGLEDVSEAKELIRIFNRYPIDELIVHPRLRKDFYGGKADRETFGLFYRDSRLPLIYNGDVRSKEDAAELAEHFPKLKGIMIGRGLAANPALAREIAGGGGLTVPELRAFHDELYRKWREELPDMRAVLGRMKELWYYWSTVLEGADRPVKKVRKARRYEEYETAAAEVFRAAMIREVPAPYGSV